MRRRTGKDQGKRSDAEPFHGKKEAYHPKRQVKGYVVAWVVVGIFLAPFVSATLDSNTFRKASWFLTLIGTAYLCVHFWKWNGWRKEVRPFKRFLLVFFLLLLELLVENFLCWVVSALDSNKYNYRPLQDLGEELLLWLCNSFPVVHAMLRTFGGWSIYHFMLLVVVIASGVVLPDKKLAHGRLSGFAMAARVAATVAVSRAIRTLSFMATVLPNPRYRCYQSKFPPVPDGWLEFIKVGFARMRGNGGCNDLIFSGHGGIYTVAMCMFQTYYGGMVSPLVWLAFMHIMCMEILDKTHYTVDMLLAWVVTYLTWYRLEWVADVSKEISPRGSRLEKYLPYICVTILMILLVIIVVGGA